MEQHKQTTFVKSIVIMIIVVLLLTIAWLIFKYPCLLDSNKCQTQPMDNIPENVDTKSPENTLPETAPPLIKNGNGDSPAIFTNNLPKAPPLINN